MNAQMLENNQAVNQEPEAVSTTGHKVWQCDICGVEMLDLHCKLRCDNCGFMRDCSDP